MHITRRGSLASVLLASVGVLLAVLTIAVPAMAKVDREVTLEEEVRLSEIRAEIERNGYHWIADHTSVSGLSPEEKDRRTGFVMTAEMEAFEANAVPDPDIERMTFRTSFDWRDFDGVTPSKDQLDCGSCWAFAAAGAVEAHVRINEGVLLDISEQQAIDCNSAGSGCDGGTCVIGFSVFKDPGAVSEACYPYRAEDGNCRQGTCEVVGLVDGYSNVVNNTATIKYAVENYGPCVTSIHVYDDFYSYSGGCYEHGGTEFTDHTVLICGWDDSMCSGNGAWLIKNSWGQDWGLNGFGWMKYGTCRIGTATSRPLNAHIPHDRLVPDEFGTIQLALDNANRGDIVKVAGGIYHENVTVPDYVQLYGGYDSTFTVRDPSLYPTIIDADQSGHGLNIAERDYIIVDGFEVEDAGGTGYYGIHLKNSDAKVRNCIVRDSWRGIGVVEGLTSATDADAIIEYCAVMDNTGAGIYVNNADNPGVIIRYTASHGNGAEGIYSSQSPTDVQFCTIVDNGSDGGIELVSSSGNIIQDNIIASNTGYGITCSGATPTVTYNDVWDNSLGSYNGCSGGTGAISDDPVFCDAMSANYSVHASSPTVGTGQYGYNMGALGIGCPLGPQNLAVVHDGASLDLSWDLPPAARADVDYYIVYRDTTQIPLTELATVPSGTQTFTDVTIPPCAPYSYWVSAVDLGGLEGAPSNKVSDELCYAGPTGVDVVYVEGANEISWSAGAGPIDRYDIYRSVEDVADSIGTVSSAESFFVDDTSDDCPRERYGYEVLPVYDTGWVGVVSENVIIDPLAAPPSGIVGQWVADDIELTWNKNCESDFRNYWVYRDTLPISPPTDPGLWIGATTDTTYLDEDLNTSLVYFYRMTTSDASQDQSEYSEMIWVGSGSVLTVPSPYGTIQAAINAASALDTVLVTAGTYNENITLKDGVKVVSSDGRATTTIQSSTSAVVSSVSLSDLSIIEGFTVDGQGTAASGLDGWDTYTRLVDCSFQNCITGANFQYGGSASVLGCTFTANQNGIAVADSSTPFLGGNTFDANVIAGVNVGGTPGPEIGRTHADANDFINKGFFQVFNGGVGTIDADYNWWDDVCPEAGWFYGAVDYTPWTDAAHTGTYTECTGVPGEEMTDRPYVSYNYPNPFNPSTAIRYSVPAPGGSVSLKVYDLTGRQVRELVSERKRSGDYIAVWYGRNDRGEELGSGVYFYRLEVGEYTFERKMVMLK